MWHRVVFSFVLARFELDIRPFSNVCQPLIRRSDYITTIEHMWPDQIDYICRSLVSYNMVICDDTSKLTLPSCDKVILELGLDMLIHQPLPAVLEQRVKLFDH